MSLVSVLGCGTWFFLIEEQLLRQTVQEERERFAREVELPERPEAETDAIDEEAWLYSSDRDYLAQLAMYKARKNGQASDERTC
jgi:hypothetical protein